MCNYIALERTPSQTEKQNFVCDMALLSSQHTNRTFQEVFRFENQTPAAKPFPFFSNSLDASSKMVSEVTKGESAHA